MNMVMELTMVMELIDHIGELVGGPSQTRTGSTQVMTSWRTPR